MADSANSQADASNSIANSTSTVYISNYIGNNNNTEPSEVHAGGSLTDTHAEWEALTYQSQGVTRGFLLTLCTWRLVILVQLTMLSILVKVG